MSGNRPPISDVPVMAPCPRCRRSLKARLDFRAPAPMGRLPCPWCRRQVTVTPLE